MKGGRSAPLSSRGRGSNVLKVCPKALKTNATQKFGARARNVLLRLVRVLLRGDAISAHFWSKVKKPIKVYSTKRWKPKSRSPRPVFIPRPRHLPFIYRGTRHGRSLKKKLQPLRRLTQKFRFFALSRLLVLNHPGGGCIEICRVGRVRTCSAPLSVVGHSQYAAHSFISALAFKKSFCFPEGKACRCKWVSLPQLNANSQYGHRGAKTRYIGATCMFLFVINTQNQNCTSTGKHIFLIFLTFGSKSIGSKKCH